MYGVTDPSAKISNEAFVERITSSDPAMTKEATDAVNDWVRMRMREDGFWRKILPPIPVANSDLDRAVDTDKPVKILDKEPNSPAAISIPLATLPFNRYIRGPRFRVMFDRISTPKFTKDVDELRTYTIDIRQVLSDNAIKDLLAEEDGKAIATINTLLGDPGTVVAETGTIQNRTIAGGISRDSVNDALAIMPQTPSHLAPATCLVNNVTVYELQKWGHDEVGGTLSEEILRNGFAERNLLNCRWIVTIKRRLVPDNVIFMFAEPKYLGKFYILNDTTMYIDRKAYMLEFFAYEFIGSAIANVAAIAKATFV